MLDIPSKHFTSSVYLHRGYEIFDIAKKVFQKSTDSALAKKIINSSTKKNFQKLVDSNLGKELQKSVLTGVSNATERAAESAYKKIGLEPTNRKRKKKTQIKSK